MPKGVIRLKREMTLRIRLRVKPPRCRLTARAKAADPLCVTIATRIASEVARPFSAPRAAPASIEWMESATARASGENGSPGGRSLCYFVELDLGEPHLFQEENH